MGLPRNLSLFVWLSLCLLASLPSGSARAHASLVRSEPENGALLSQAPASIRFEFSEPVDPAFFRASLVDSAGAPVVAGPGSLDPADPQVLLLDLPALPEGAYTALWQVRSAVDGHITSGGVAFAAGPQAQLPSLLPAPGSVRPAAELPPLAGTLLRWANFLAAVLLAGPLLFGLLVWRPAFRAWEGANPGAEAQARRTFVSLAWAGLLGSALAGAALLLFQAWQAAAGAAGPGFFPALGALLGGRAGLLFVARLSLLGLVAVLLARAKTPGGPEWAFAGLAALGGLLTISLYSHSAALEGLSAVLADWVHLVALSAWIGGLLPLFLVLRRSELPPAALVPRFSRVALASVAALSATGLYLAYRQVGSFEALAATAYGQSLGIKVALAAGLLLLGAANLLVFSPRLSKPGSSAARRLGISLRGELLLAGLALLAAAVMAGAPPSRQALEAERRAGYAGSYSAGGVRLDLWVAPGRPGYNEVALDLSSTETLAGPDPEVLLRFEMLDHDMGVTQVTAEPQPGTGRYRAAGGHLSMAGDWQVEAILRREGQNDVRHVFDVTVQAPDEGDFAQNPVPADGESLAGGRALYGQYCVTCHGLEGKGDGPAALTMNPPPADLTQHSLPGVHPDGQLYEWIANGYPGSPMPAFAEFLSEEEIWNLVNYLRAMALDSQ
jgi:copper transport protein